MSYSDMKKDFAKGKIVKSDFISHASEYHDVLFEYSKLIEETDITGISISEGSVEFFVEKYDIKMTVPRHESRVAPIEILNFGEYEPQESQVLEMLLNNANCFLDIGANIGWFSIKAAKQYPNLKIKAFEPMPEFFEFLHKNIALNNVGRNINTFNYGLSDTSGATSFFCAPMNGTNASLLNVAESDSAKEVSCLTMTLDEWNQNFEDQVDVVKCDVEGAELLVFRGGVNTIKKHHPMIFSEMLRKWCKPFGYHPNDMIKFFSDLGYGCYAIGDDSVIKISEVTSDTLETNFVFLHPSHHSVKIQDLLAQ